MAIRPVLLSALVALAVAGCTDAPVDEPPQPLVIGPLLRSYLAGENDTIGAILESPMAMVVWKDSLAIADGMAGRVHVLSRSLAGGRTFGRTGNGPGEMESPQNLAVTGDTLVIFDRSNARFLWVGPDGSLIAEREQMIRGIRTDFAAEPGFTLWIPESSEDNYVSITGPDGSAEAIARPEGAVASGPQMQSGMRVTTNMVVPFRGDPAVVDAENGTVTFTRDGRSAGVASLPEQMRNDAEKRMAELAHPGRIVHMISGAGPAPDGVLVWMLSTTDVVAAVADPSGRWTPLVKGPRSGDLPTAVTDLLLWDDELILLTDEGLRVYQVGL